MILLYFISEANFTDLLKSQILKTCQCYKPANMMLLSKLNFFKEKKYHQQKSQTEENVNSNRSFYSVNMLFVIPKINSRYLKNNIWLLYYTVWFKKKSSSKCLAQGSVFCPNCETNCEIILEMCKKSKKLQYTIQNSSNFTEKTNMLSKSKNKFRQIVKKLWDAIPKLCE